MKRATVVALILFAFAFAIFSVSAAICDGWYDLIVAISPESAAGVTSISYVGVPNAETAEAVIAKVDTELKYMKHRDTTEPFIVRVGFSFRESLGITWDHVQEYSDIIVVLHYNDGSQEVHRLAVPNRNVTKRITITAKSIVTTH